MSELCFLSTLMAGAGPVATEPSSRSVMASAAALQSAVAASRPVPRRQAA